MALDTRGVANLKDQGGKEGKEWIESWTTIKYAQATPHYLLKRGDMLYTESGR